MTQNDQDKWPNLLTSLPKTIETFLQKRATDLVSLDEAEQDYVSSLADLPLTLSERIDRPDSQESVDTDTPFSWCVCEMPEGDFPRVRVFGDFEAMTRHISKLEGEEVSVWVFYGTPISLTQSDKDGFRYLLTSRREAFRLSLSQSATEPVVSVARDQVSSLNIQEDGWLGDPNLTESTNANYYIRGATRDNAFDSPDDEDDGEVVESLGT